MWHSTGFVTLNQLKIRVRVNKELRRQLSATFFQQCNAFGDRTICFLTLPPGAIRDRNPY